MSAPEIDRFERSWLDADGMRWHATVDRLAMKCGACDRTRHLHIETPGGERYTFTLAPDADLADVPDEALERLVRQRARNQNS